MFLRRNKHAGGAQDGRSESESTELEDGSDAAASDSGGGLVAEPGVEEQRLTDLLGLATDADVSAAAQTAVSLSSCTDCSSMIAANLTVTDRCVFRISPRFIYGFSPIAQICATPTPPGVVSSVPWARRCRCRAIKRSAKAS